LELQISRISLSETSRSEVQIHHRGQTIEFNVSDFKGIIKDLKHDIFGEINAYWAWLPLPAQDHIFATYREIKNVFSEYPSNEQLMLRLFGLVGKLVNAHKLEDVKHWMTYHEPNIYYPPDLKTVFVPHEMPGTAEGTYLLEDYSWLVALSIVLRPMFPVWGEFIAYIKEDFGPNWKEYYAYRLLTQSYLASSAPMERLRIYVKSMVSTDKKVEVSNSAHILHGGVSVEDYPEWVIGLVLVRKLIIGDVKGLDPKAHLASQIFNFIKYKTKPRSDNGFSGIVREKRVEGQGQGDENQQSKLESNKVKAPVSEGKIAPHLFYAREMRRIALQIDPTLPLEYLEQSFESVKALENELHHKQQTVLVMYALKYRNQVPPRALHYYIRNAKLEAIAAAQAIYWHKGYHELAGLVSAVARSNADEHTATEGGPRTRLSTQTLEELAKWFPHPRRQGGKQKQQRQVTAAEVSIELVDKGLSEHAWILTLPQEWATILKQNPNDRNYGVPGNLKVKLAQLAIAFASRSF
jgi:hypothetical protein